MQVGFISDLHILCKMKNLLIIISFLCFVISSGAQTKGFDLPEKAVLFISTHFPDNKIVKIEFEDDEDEYEVKLNSGYELEFDLEGEWKEIESDYNPLPKSIIDLLPADLLVYIATKYPRRAIIKIEKLPTGYEIELSNSKELIFDQNGKFLRKS